MSSSRFLWLTLTACAALPAAWLLGSPFAPKPASVVGAVVVPTEADAAAAGTVADALARLYPERLPWLETAIWQQVSVHGLTYQSQGRYRSGPGQRLAVDLKTQIEGTEGTLHLASDGSTIWKAMRIGSGPWCSVTKVNLDQVLQALPASETLDHVREQYLRSQSFGGVRALLENLRDDMCWVRKERVRRAGREFIKLIGFSRAEKAAELGLGDAGWPAGMPRQCRLYLDPSNLWPFRVEWWGPDPPRAGEVLLLQMEFRDPVFRSGPLSDRTAAEFRFDPGLVVVQDQTSEVAERLRNRIERLQATLRPK
jgi:hypothetical protein